LERRGEEPPHLVGVVAMRAPAQEIREDEGTEHHDRHRDDQQRTLSHRQPPNPSPRPPPRSGEGEQKGHPPPPPPPLQGEGEQKGYGGLAPSPRNEVSRSFSPSPLQGGGREEGFVQKSSSEQRQDRVAEGECMGPALAVLHLHVRIHAECME